MNFQKGRFDRLGQVGRPSDDVTNCKFRTENMRHKLVPIQILPFVRIAIKKT